MKRSDFENLPDFIKNQLTKPMSFLYDYFPCRAKEVSENAWKVRRLIWGFKDAKEWAQKWAAEIVEARIQKIFGKDLNGYTLICIPSSTAEKTAARYGAFAEKVAAATGMTNGIHMVSVSGGRLAIHEGRHGKRVEDTQVIEFNAAELNGRKVILFDDVCTTGMSYARFAAALENVGATVVGGVFLAKTVVC